MLYFLLASLFLSLQVCASHIIGGDITYECLSQGKYRFTLSLYRDCVGMGAPFDSASGSLFTGTVTIYQGDSTVPMTINGLNHILLPSPVITRVEPNLSNPCLDPLTDVCVEEGVYVFDVDLPVNTQSYHIVYQRCCRNFSTTNIVYPGGTGETFYIELTPAAQQFCNNSPAFNDFPPIVICAGEPIDFDHSASDADGDVLVYELCHPFTGGGFNTQYPNAPNGVAPDPDLPPPYTPVLFIDPPFSFDLPLSADPALAINSSTGFMTGVPIDTGQYVVGVCVSEFRNGQLLSRVLRDFQFNVELCEFKVLANIAEDNTVQLQGEQYFVVNVCGENTVNFQNQSTQSENISSVLWEFDLGGNIKTSTQWDATFSFPGGGTYYGNLFVNPNATSGTCSDTARIEVNVFPEITADFTFDYDTCLVGPVTFTDLSESGAGPGAIISWDWSFGDGNLSNEQHPVHTYQASGQLSVELLVLDTNGCTGLRTKTVRYFPVPQLLVVAPSDFIGCQPAKIFFDNLSSLVDGNYVALWGFGDGGTGTDISPTYTYENAGTYSVSLSITSPFGCSVDTIWNDLITILPSPIADFTFSPQNPTNLVPTVSFADQSFEPVAWKWSFGNIGTSIQQNPSFTFPDTGVQRIELIVFNQSGCADTTVQFLDVIPEVRYFLPNAFTPDGNGLNDGFRGNGIMDGATDFNLSIWNKHGEKLFETDDPEVAWNGRRDNTGSLSAQGVYIVVVSFRDPRGALRELRGYATLVK